MDRLTLFFLASAERTYTRLLSLDAVAWSTEDVLLHRHIITTCERLVTLYPTN